MPFPIGPDPRFGEPETLFAIQDPFGLRKCVTPLFVANHTSGSVRGCGTSFFITPFGRQLSAMHVITDFFNERGIAVLPNSVGNLQSTDAIIAILHDPGLVFGTCPAGSILPASDIIMFPVDQSQDPLAITRSSADLARLEPSLDLVAWNIPGVAENRSVYLPLSINRRRPAVKAGDRVLAVGYPKNGGERQEGRAITSYSEEMFGSIGKVLEVSTEWDQSKKVWPTFVVDAYWPPGMSGGPVFNEDGLVVGIVSRGGETWSKALWLQHLPFNRQIFGCVDADNPGWVKGWGACNPQSLVELFQTREAAQEYVEKNGPALDARPVSTEYRTRFRSSGRRGRTVEG